MKEITNLLNLFLDNNITPIIKDKFQKTRFSPRTRKIIETIFNQIHVGYHHANLKVETVNSTQPPKGVEFNYYPFEIKETIKTMDTTTYKCDFELNEHSISIYFVCPKHISKKNALEYAKRIYTWLFVAFHYSPKKCSQTMTIFLYFTNLTKKLPKRGEQIEEIHANTAFTTSCKPTTEIHLYREEEWFKVLIHETFHCLGLDFSEFNNTASQKKILSIFPVKSKVNLFETYCETWAELMNTIFIAYSHTTNRNNIDTDKLIKKTEMLLNQERIFSLFQNVKVLQFYGLNYKDLYEKTEMAHMKRLHRYKENTNVLSYYIIKSIFMFYINDFIEWCFHHNKSVLNFNKLPSVLNKNIEDYCKLIEDLHNKPEYNELVSLIEKWYDKPKNMKSIEMQTLRMTMLET
jgi:hypothetical protein